MKSILRSALALGIALGVQAGSDWLTDPAQAKAQATKENKVIFADFTGSDWCPPCKKLKASILETEVFKEYAKKHLVLLELDYPRHTAQPPALKAQNARLQQRFRITGYPTVIILDKNSKELARWVGYGGENPSDYISKIEAVIAKQVALADGH